MNNSINKKYAFICIFLVFTLSLKSQNIQLYLDLSKVQSEIIESELKSALPEKAVVSKKSLKELPEIGKDISIVFSLLSDAKTIESLREKGCEIPENIKKEGFCITKSKINNSLILVGATDMAGLLYGAYELAEQIETKDIYKISDEIQNPYMTMRGIKFNIPLDSRTPTYTMSGDAAYENVEAMWDFEFWKSFIDNMSKNRYNFLSCWNLNPFPSMVKLKDYPNVALNDVMRPKTSKGRNQEPEAKDFNKDLEVVKKISIDEKINHWKRVMKYGKERNVHFYFLTWNIFPYVAHGTNEIDNNIHNQETIDYYYKSVKKFVETYPDLGGFGVTAGERMPGATFQEKEDWTFNTYGQGVLDALKNERDRKFTFIHRQHQSDASKIEEIFDPLIENKNIDFIYSFKYAKAHVYSSVKQPYSDEFVQGLRENSKVKTIWTMRNDDNYYLNWGATGFVRDFIKNIPYDISQGYYFGSDGYIPGRSFLSLYPNNENEIDFERNWFSWMLWGRLGYNPEMDDKKFISILQNRFHGIPADKLFAALECVSMIYPITTGYHWGALDFEWYIESCQSKSHISTTFSGFNDINSFISQGTHPGTDNIRIPDFVDGQIAGKTLKGATPYMVANSLDSLAERALVLLKDVKCNGSFELLKFKEDIAAMAYLGKYYGNKIYAATELDLFRKTTKAEHQENCLKSMYDATFYWRKYVTILGSLYKNPIWLNRVGDINLRNSYYDVLHDLISVGGDVERLKHFEPTIGGTIYEAELADSDIRHTDDSKDIFIYKKDMDVDGYTGKAYLKFSKRDFGDNYLEWIIPEAEDGLNLFEVRYSTQKGNVVSFPKISINNIDVPNVQFWGTGSKKTWCSDKFYFKLRKGKNSFKIYPSGEILIDHLNVVNVKDL